MDGVTIQFTGAADFKQWVDPQAMVDRTRDTLTVIISDAASLLGEASPVGIYGHMQGAWMQTRGVEVKDYEIVGYSDPTPTAPYAWWVIFGRRPGKQPPVVSLMQWVYRVMGVACSEVFIVARNLARKIGARGTKPNDFVTPIVNENTSFWGERIAAAAMPPAEG